MAACEKPPERETYEVGNEPSYVIHDAGRCEDAGDGLIRVYFTSRRGRLDKTEFSMTCAPETLARIGRDLMEIAAEFHTEAEFRKALREH